MLNISVNEFKRKVSFYLSKIKKGETVIISDKEKLIARIAPVNPSLDEKRPIGLAEGDFKVPDDFDSPLPNEIEILFEK